MLNEMLGMSCPVCGRYDIRYPLPDYWCDFCGGGDHMKLKIQIAKINDRVDLLEDLLQWKSMIIDLDETL